MASEVAEISLMTEGLVRGSAAEPAEPALVALVERVRSGDHAAFEEIVICYQRRILSTAWRVLGNEEEAKDAAQEVFLRAFRYLRSFNTRQDFGAWLYRITINVCRDARRKRSRIPVTSLQDDLDFDSLASASTDADLERDAIRSEQRALVAEALATLTKKEREALVMRDLEGLPTEEVARLLGTSKATIRSHVCAARAKIKEFHQRALRRAMNRQGGK
jgi:RNA polymerase sigma-70 factor (ECF subfamily)